MSYSNDVLEDMKNVNFDRKNTRFNPKWQLMEHHDDKFIEIKVVRLDKVKNTIEDLKKMLE